jgi:hypothetical protein
MFCATERLPPHRTPSSARSSASVRDSTFFAFRETEEMMADNWTDEDRYWRTNYGSRPYATGRDYDTLSGGYRYGVEAADRYPGRSWNDVESDLQRDWDTYQYRGGSTWEQMKDAVRDAWDRMTGRQSRSI